MGRHRVTVAALFLLAVLAGVVLVVVSSRLCPAEMPGQPCAAVAANRTIVVVLTAATVGLFVAPFAFLAELLARRRIVYRGAWWRAARRGTLVALAVAAVAGLRLGGALTPPIALFVVIVAVGIEWFSVRNVDLT